jgi:photosystem II stability/assembly factor-like uncharacterized protein
MKKIMMLCAVSVFAVGCSSTPKTASAPAQTTTALAAAPLAAAADTTKKDSEVVCKMQKVLGSNMKKRVCTTKSRIADNEADTKRIVHDMSVGNTQALRDR